MNADSAAIAMAFDVTMLLLSFVTVKVNSSANAVQASVARARGVHARGGRQSEVVEAAVREAIAAIEEDAADVVTFGCSALFWLQPLLQKRLEEMGWEVPVLEGYSCAITLAKAMSTLA